MNSIITASKLVILFLTFLALTATAFAAASTPAPLPPAAQKAVNKGIIAAKAPDYLLAIRYFEEARKIAPQAPVVYLNMGLAESKIPGRELRAIAWFGAYLAAYPNAPNAAAVKEQLDVLDVKSLSNTSRLLKTLQGAAEQFSDSQRGEKLYSVVKLWLDAGDTAAALKAAKMIRGYNRDEFYQSMALDSVAYAQARGGDIAGAEKTAELIPLPSHKTSALINIAEARNEAGDSAGSKTTLLSAVKTAASIGNETSYGILSPAYVQSQKLRDIAAAQARVGDIAGALKTTDSIKVPESRCFAQVSISEFQIRFGDIAGAQKTLVSAQKSANLIDYAPFKSDAERIISQVQAMIADAPNAARQAKSGTVPPNQPAVTVSDWLKKLDDGDQAGNCALNTEPFLDLSGYLKSQPSDDAAKMFSAMLDAAKKTVSAQNVIAGMLKRQTGMIK